MQGSVFFLFLNDGWRVRCWLSLWFGSGPFRVLGKFWLVSLFVPALVLFLGWLGRVTTPVRMAGGVAVRCHSVAQSADRAERWRGSCCFFARRDAV